MDGRFNTIAGWVLGAGIVLLGATIVTGELFKAERPETMGFSIPGVEAEGEEGAAAAEQPIAHFLQTADAARGEQLFSRCQSCHTATNGGANGIGPNLWGAVGNQVAHHPAYAYSDALKNHGGTWDWDTLSAWLHSPSRFAPGTKMTFAGISDPQDRANLLLFLNQHGGTLTIPPPPAEGAAPAAGNAAAGNEAGGNEAGANTSTGNAAAPAAAPAAAGH